MVVWDDFDWFGLISYVVLSFVYGSKYFLYVVVVEFGDEIVGVVIIESFVLVLGVVVVFM